MEKKAIDLKQTFAMNTEYFIKGIGECFETLNKFLQSKSGVTEGPLFIRKGAGHEISIGFVPKVKGSVPFFSNEKIPSDWGALDRACMVQFVIFEACKDHGCYDQVPMCGAPEEGGETFFTFTHEDVEYTYRLWN